MAEPSSLAPAERPKLSETEVRPRAAETVAELVRRGPQLLANSTMKLELQPYGYRIRFEQTESQTKALDRDKTDRFSVSGRTV